MSRISFAGRCGTAAVAVATSLGVATAASTAAQTAHHAAIAPKRCPPVAKMSKAAGATVSLPTFIRRHGTIMCSYSLPDGGAIAYDSEKTFGQSESLWLTGIRGAAKHDHVKLHRYRAGIAAAWYRDTKKSMFSEVYLGKMMLSIEVSGLDSEHLVKIARAFI